MRRLLVLCLLAGCGGDERTLQVVPALPDCSTGLSINEVQLTSLGDFPPARARTTATSPTGTAQLSLPGGTRSLEVDGLGPGGLVAFARTSPFSLSALGTRVAVNYGAPDSLCATPAMHYARAGHQATLLQSGGVLLSGGHDVDGFAVAKMEAYLPFGDAATPAGKWIVVDASGPTAIDPRAALGHAAAVLPTGELFITGGAPSVGGQPIGPAFEGYTRHDASGVLVDGKILPGDARAFHTATVLADGRLVLAGGCGAFDSGGCVTPLDSSEIYTPETGQFSDGPRLGHARFGHQAFLRGDGKILIVGGGPTEIFDPSMGSADAGDLPGPAALLQTGGALAAGALWLDGDGVIPIAPLPAARSGQTLTALEDGAVLVAGGGTVGLDPALILYDPLNGPRSLTGPFPRKEHTATRLGDGSVLLAGGSDNSGGASSAASIFLHTPLGPFSNLPTLTFDGSNLPLEPRRPDRLRLADGRMQLMAAAASADARPAELALVGALDVGDFQIQLDVGRSGDGGAAVIFGWSSNASYAFVRLDPGQQVGLELVTASGVAEKCTGELLADGELPDGDTALVTVNWRNRHLDVYTPSRRLLQCTPDDVSRGAVGVGTLHGTALFDNLSITR